MVTLPAEYGRLVCALTHHLRDADAGLLTTEAGDDPTILWAALDHASQRAGKHIRQAWIGHDRSALAWLHEDDRRLIVAPWLTVVGVTGTDAA